MRTLQKLCIFLSTLVLLHAVPAYNEQILTGSGGDCVAMYKEWAVVGDSTNSTVRVYRLNYSKIDDQTMSMWELHTTLTGTNDFGASVAISGDYLVVGEPSRAASKGRASLYKYDFITDTWSRVATANGSTNGFKLGTSVAIASDGTNAKIAVGVPNTSNSNGSVGSVYTYNYTGNISPIVSILQPYVEYDKGFGESLDMKGDKLIVGAPLSELPGTEIVGAAYTYEYNGTGWEPLIQTGGTTDYRIKSEDPADDGEYFGTNVAIDGNVSLISGGSISSTASTSSIYTFDGSIWNETFEQGNWDGGGVDIDDGIYLMAQRYARLRFYNQTDGNSLFDISTSSSSVSFQSNTSVSLYKEQVITNDPGTKAIAYDVPCGIKPVQLNAAEWTMISIPCDVTGKTVQDVFGNLGTVHVVNADNGDFVITEQNGTDWSGTVSANVRLSATDPVSQDKSYWIYLRNAQYWYVDSTASSTRTQLKTAAELGIATIDNKIGGYVSILLPDSNAESGDNNVSVMVGNPYPRAFYWSNVRVGTTLATYLMGTTDADSIIKNSTAYVYDLSVTDANGQNYRAVSTTPGFTDKIEPYQGFWVKVIDQSDGTPNTNIDLILPFEK